jgi:hypothetical protein
VFDVEEKENLDPFQEEDIVFISSEGNAETNTLK